MLTKKSQNQTIDTATTITIQTISVMVIVSFQLESGNINFEPFSIQVLTKSCIASVELCDLVAISYENDQPSYNITVEVCNGYIHKTTSNNASVEFVIKLFG